ncbi:hypothetical protein ACFX2A_024531 [Malus domestica]
MLAPRDLDLISSLGELLISRPGDSSLSHKNALQHCLEQKLRKINLCYVRKQNRKTRTERKKWRMLASNQTLL